VSAGGDQGADFETYATARSSQPFSPFFAQVSHDKVVFACSLQKNLPKKINADLQAAHQRGEGVRQLFFFSIWDLPVGKRHKLQTLAQQNFNIQLEVLDARAISELLADPEVFWIAQRFLSIPSDLTLLAPTAPDGNYEKALKADINAAHLRASEFFLIKNALRLATFNPERHSDLPALIKKVRFFRQHPAPSIQRKAFYEEFVAALRGMEAVGGLENELEDYLTAIVDTQDPAELEDAACILTYAAGATARGLLRVTLSFITLSKKRLLDRVQTLLEQNPSPVGRSCALLFTKGFLTLLNWTEALSIDGDIQTSSRLAVEEALPTWRSMIKKVRDAPMFPLERFGNLLSELAGAFRDVKGFTKLVSETDKLLATRVGQHKLAEQAFDRSKSLLEAQRIPEAIDELHSANLHAFTKETARDYVYFCIFLANLYSQVGLYCAAKCYGLAAAFAALKLDDDSLRSVAYRGLAQAASADHANGASLSFFLSATAFVHISEEFSMSGSSDTKQSEWAKIDYYCLLLTRASALISLELHRFLREIVLPRLGLSEIYDETVPRLEANFQFRDIDQIARKAIGERIMAPFSDVGPRRRLAWEQLSIRWFVDWQNDFETTRAAEGFISALQIFLVDIRDIELSLLSGDVRVSIELHEGGLAIEDLPDNEHLTLRVKLQRSQSRGEPDDHIIPHAVGASILNMVSALPPEKFLKIYESRVHSGLHGKLYPRASYNRIFSEFFPKDLFNELHDKTRTNQLALPSSIIATSEGLRGPSEAHPEYSARDSQRAIARRYARIPGIIKHTLARLAQDNSFRSTVQTLREKGWKDWHILLAVANIRQNYVLHQTVSPSEPLQQYKTKGTEIFNRDEADTDPAPPAAIFTAEEMERALTMSQISTLRGMGFDCFQRTPNLRAIDRFLTRFNYWTDDAPHQDPFPAV
jgi:hypothetical protein